MDADRPIVGAPEGRRGGVAALDKGSGHCLRAAPCGETPQGR
jgi:hypothetical protein